jgi:hypothetical protein
MLLGAFFDVTNPMKVSAVPCGASPQRPRAQVGSIAEPTPRDFAFRTDFEGTDSPVVTASAAGTVNPLSGSSLPA